MSSAHCNIKLLNQDQNQIQTQSWAWKLVPLPAQNSQQITGFTALLNTTQ